jgi:UDP-N-acetylglucosamine--N-acetylmuramyl-(pentapeptide) pyrophosphoryl-undecaprenol N-acetylglucosamine transferase
MIQNNSFKNIIITAGGTGGHLFPASVLAKSLAENSNYQVNIITDKRSFKYGAWGNSNSKIHSIYGGGIFGKNIFLIVKNLFLLFLGIIQSLILFKKLKPSIVISFGGYISLPVLFSAILFKKKIIIHEQNAYIGRANRLFLPFATYFLTTFKIMYGVKSKYLYKMYHVGLPLREDFLNLRPKFTANSKLINILFLGGSQGANIFSNIIPESFLLLSKQEQQHFQVFHQCREAKIKEVNALWEKTNVKYEVSTFFNNVAYLMHNSNLIFSRSGSGTINEILSQGKFAAYIPYKFAIDNHQFYNATSIAKQTKSLIITEEKLNPKILSEIYRDILYNKIDLELKEKLSFNAFTNNSHLLIVNKIKEII